MNIKYAIYLRVSTDNQDVRTQEDHCRQLIKNQSAVIFSDPDMSSRIPMKDRLGLQAMLNSLKSGTTVIVYKLDRLSRDVIEMVTIYRQIKQKKCFLQSYCDPNCDNEFHMGLMGVLAQKERTDISERTKAKLASKKSRGERTGTIPYGYRLDLDNLIQIKRGDKIELKPARLIPDKNEQEILNMMSRYLQDGYSYREIAQVLTDQGYMNRQGNPFQHMSVYRILKRSTLTIPMDQLQQIEESPLSLAQ
jgi:DNA invertase Pin-like site-specific DNA recombinase